MPRPPRFWNEQIVPVRGTFGRDLSAYFEETILSDREYLGDLDTYPDTDSLPAAANYSGKTVFVVSGEGAVPYYSDGSTWTTVGEEPTGPFIYESEQYGMAGLEEMMTSAELAAGDILLTPESAYQWLEESIAYPLDLGRPDLSDPTNYTAGVGVDPVISLDDWVNSGQANSPSYSVVDGTFTMSAPSTGSVAVVRWNPGQVGETRVLLFEDLRATGLSGSTVIELIAEGGLYITIRKGTTNWELRTGSSTYASMGHAAATASRLELKYHMNEPMVQYRWDTGPWQFLVPFEPTPFVSTMVLRITTTYTSGAATCSFSAIACAPAVS